jgi:hypothetical protein
VQPRPATRATPDLQGDLAWRRERAGSTHPTPARAPPRGWDASACRRASLSLPHPGPDRRDASSGEGSADLAVARLHVRAGEGWITRALRRSSRQLLRAWVIAAGCGDPDARRG